MKKADYYINVIKGDNRKVSGYVEAVTDSKGNTLMIGYDKRYEGGWKATELHTGFLVSIGEITTKKKCVEWVHDNIDIIVETYNRKMADERCYNSFIKPFRDFVDAN